MKTYDVIIIGAGPAGATLARLLNKNISVLLINREQHEKPCGGLLAPDAQKVLAMFDLTLPKDILVDPQIFSVRTMDLDNGLEQWYQRLYINMSRTKFDEWLLSLLDGSVDLVNGRCTNIEKNKIEYIIDGETFQAQGKIIIGADGANSIIEKKCFNSMKTRKYVAIQQWFRYSDCNIKPFYSCVFDKLTSDCCSWIIGKDDYIIFGGAFSPKGCRENFELQKKRLSKFSIELNNPVKTEACMVLRPTGIRSFNCGHNFENYSVFLIGEAAGFISPSSLEGISYAIKSATLLSDSINRYYNVDNKQLTKILGLYKKSTGTLKARLLIKNLKCPFMYNPTLRKIVMKSKFTSIKMHTKTD